MQSTTKLIFWIAWFFLMAHFRLIVLLNSVQILRLGCAFETVQFIALIRRFFVRT
jgi:hypothetical protein